MSVTSARAEPADAQARAEAIAEPGSVLVQAPAGSGKTTLLAQRYLRLLATVDVPERILALTFTRRAAQEMRDRVLYALQSAHLPTPPLDLNARTWDLALAASRHLESLHIEVDQHPSRMRIETIDAFNSWLAGQLPIAAGTGARLTMLADAKSAHQEAARRALAHDERDAFANAVERVLALDDQRWRRLRDLITDMLPSRDRWLPLLAGGLQAASTLDESQLQRVRAQFEEDLGLLVTRVLRSAHEAIGEQRMAALSGLLHGAALRVPDERHALAEWRRDASSLRPELEDLARWRGLARVLLTGNARIRARLTKNEGFAPNCPDKPMMQELLAALAADRAAVRALGQIGTLPDPTYEDAEWLRVRDVAQVLVLAAAELEQVFRELGATDFPGASMAALRALGTASAPTDLALRLDYRLQHILVDEFQDTSSAQLELLGLLTAGWQRGEERSVFCVGDPMQSIYGFRQAEVRAFLQLAEDGIGEVRFAVKHLTANFRGAPGLVDWVNHTFSRMMPRIDDRDRGAIAYRPSVSGLEQTQHHDADVAVTTTAFATPGDEALGIARLIADRRQRHPEWRIAVLVRAKSHARLIASALRTRGIAFGAVDIEPLQDREVIRDLLSLTRALLHLGDRTAWLAVLRAPWIGLELEDLLRIARASDIIWDALLDEALLARLSESGRARCRRTRQVLEAGFRVREHTPFARWVERIWLNLGGASCVGAALDLEHALAAFARLRDLERRGLPDPADLAEGFADLFAQGAPAPAVEVMTIHKAKGLEFDLVIVPALDRGIAQRQHDFLLLHAFAREDRDGMVIAARPAVGAAAPRLFEFLRHQARDAAALESQRLLYVACTRAKSQLVLTATIALGSDPDADDDTGADSDTGAEAGREPDASPPGDARTWAARSGSLLEVLWPIIGPQFEMPVGGSTADARPDGTLRGGPLLRVPEGFRPVLLSGQGAPATPAELAVRVETPVFDWAGETARLVGSLVHAELQAMDLEGAPQTAIRSRSARFLRWLELRGVPRELVRDAGDRVAAALLGVLEDPRGRWILQRGHREAVREHALSGLLNGQIVRVVLDRSFIDDQGVRWVIDYKTSQHMGGGREEFLDREVLRYRAQLERYAMLAQCLGPEPLRVGLYFPLMRAWREWTPG